MDKELNTLDNKEASSEKSAVALKNNNTPANAQELLKDVGLPKEKPSKPHTSENQGKKSDPSKNKGSKSNVRVPKQSTGNSVKKKPVKSNVKSGKKMDLSSKSEVKSKSVAVDKKSVTEKKSDKKLPADDNTKKSFKDLIPIKLKEPEYSEDDFYEEERPVRIVRKKRSTKLSFALIMLFLIIGISVLLSVTIIYIGKEMLGIDKSSNAYIIEIPEGATTSEIAQLLKDEDIILVPKLFEIMAKLQDDVVFVAGEHQVRPNMAYETIIDELCTNPEKDRKYVTVTFPEGINLIDAANILEENGVCEARSFIYYFNTGFDKSSYKFYSYLPQSSSLKFYAMEGYLFPDTYDFYVNEEPDVVCKKILNNFEDKFEDSYYSRLTELNMTLDEVITLASIVQAEAASVSDMKLVASVFHNRLNNSDTFPMLQSDPTRVYVEDVIQKNTRVDDVAMNTAYNTYESAGLPPGAICNPGKDAIEAVLYPENTNYFYFCANVDTGEVFYAETLAQHEENLVLAGIN